MNPLAKELNQTLINGNRTVFDLLSQRGKKLFFPKGILSQSAEAKKKADKINATIGIAREKGGIMCFPSLMEGLGYTPEESLSYAPSFGIPELRKAWQDSLLIKNPGLKGKIFSLPIVSCGITHAISTFAEIWCEAGDSIILPDMFWGNYKLILETRLGIKLKHYPVFNPDGRYNTGALIEAAKKEAEEKGKAIVLLNFPHNPTGYSISKKEAEELVRAFYEIAEEGKKLIIVCDDAYFGLFYEEESLKESLFAHFADLHENILAIKLDGTTKENFAWGLRIGFISYATKLSAGHSDFYNALENKTAACIRGSISNASHLAQNMILRSLKNPENPKEQKEKYDILKARALKVKELLEEEKYKKAFTAYPFNSGYFMCAKLNNVEAENLRLHLLDKYGVGIIALDKENIRIAFSCTEIEDIDSLFDTIVQGIDDLKAK